jgi:hypothetical protein
MALRWTFKLWIVLKEGKDRLPFQAEMGLRR